MITLNRRERMTLAVTAAVLLTLPAVHPLYVDGDWVLRCVGGVLAVQAVGFFGRVVRVPALLQPVLGIATLLFYVTVVFAGDTLSLVVPTAETFTVLGNLLDGAFDSISTLVAPVPTSEGLVLLGVLATGGIAVLTDAVAVIAQRAALAGLPLLLLFAAPAAIGDASAGWGPFALAGVGWLLVLLADGTERVHRWGVALAAPGRRAKPGGGLGYAGTRIGVVAVGLAVAVPVLLPDVSEGSGSRGDDGPTTITTYNPLTKLRGELTLPAPRPVLSYTTDDPDPDYLRMTTLEVYDGQGWKQDTLNGRQDRDGVEGRTLPTPIGVSDVTASGRVTANISIATLNAYWLPAPATPSVVDVEGPWLWDRESESVFATRTDTTEIAPYTITSIKTVPDAVNLRSAPATIPEQIQPYAAMPQATAYVRSVTEQVTRNRTGAYAKALALQSFFRSDQFSYSLRTATPSSPDGLEDFLRSKRGFCEQYASAMAAMLRIEGIPARVAVGFTPGQLQRDGVRLVTTEQAHAWPEAWINGAGWVRFEPTPGQGFAPPYTQATGEGPAPETDTGPEPTPTATTGPGGAQQQVKPDAEDLAGGTPTGDAGGGDDGFSFPTRAALVVLAVLAVLALPGGVHVLRRRSRWQQPGAAAAWAQLQDDTVDVGLPLDPSRSPRQVVDGLARQAALDGGDLEALRRIALAVERDRYAPAGDAPTGADLHRDTTAVRHALHAPLSRPRRLRLLALPPSTLRWARDGVGGALRGAVEGVAGLGAGLTTRLRRG